MKVKKDAENAAKRNLMEAFWKLYEKNRIDKISVTAICEAAGYHRSTFYDYFKDVYDVLEQIEESVVTAEEFEQIIFENMKKRNGKEAALQDILSLYEEKNMYFTVLLGEHGDPAFRNKLLQRIAPVLMKHLHFPTIRSQRKLHYLMEYQSSAVLSTITLWYKNGKDMPIEELINLLISITTNGFQKEITKMW